MSQVKVSQAVKVSERENMVLSEFEGITEVSSDLKLSGLKVLEHVEGKRLHVLVYLLKDDLWRIYLSRSQVTLNDSRSYLESLDKLEGQYSDELPEETQRQIRMDVSKHLSALSKNEELLDAFQEIMGVSGKAPDAELVEKIVAVKISKQRFLSKFFSKDLSASLQEADKALSLKKYREAIDIYRLILADNPNHKLAEDGLKVAKKGFADDLLRQAEEKSMSGKYSQAIECVRLAIANGAGDEAVLLESRIGRRYFDALAININSALDAGDLTNAERLFQDLALVWESDKSEYELISRRLARLRKKKEDRESELAFGKHMHKFRLSINSKDFEAAEKQLASAEEISPGHADCVRAREQLQKVRYKHEKRSELNRQPFKYVFTFGAGGYSHLPSTSKLTWKNVERGNWNPAFDVGLFRKIGIRRRFRGGKDFSSSTLLGLFGDVGSFNLDLKAKTLNKDRASKNYFYRLEFGASIRELVRLSGGWMKAYSEGEKYNFLSATTGLAIKIGRISVLANYSQLYRLEEKEELETEEDNFQSMVKFGLRYHLNFYRKLSKHQKDELRLSSGLR